MSDIDQTREVVRKYCAAWMRGDVAAARAFLAEDLKFRGSIDRFDRADDFIKALGEFVGVLSDVRMLEQYYDHGRAALLYECITTTPAETVRTAEFLMLTDGKIKDIRLVFDATKLREFMGR